MGDFCEFINEKSFNYETQIISPQQQFDEFIRLFKPFAEENRILLMIKGNHEDRYFTKVDGLRTWCQNYGIPYNGRHGFVNLNGTTIYAHHPKTSATTTAGRNRVFMKMRNVQDADIYLSGHFHSLFQETACRYDKHGDLYKVHFGCTGSYINFRNSYAEDKLYEPNEIGCKKITITDDEILMENFTMKEVI